MTHSCHSHLLLLGCHISKIECHIYGEIKTDYILMYIESVCCEVIFFLVNVCRKETPPDLYWVQQWHQQHDWFGKGCWFGKCRPLTSTNWILWSYYYYYNLKWLVSVLIYYIFKNAYTLKCIPVLAKLNLHQTLLQSSVSHDPSEIILICWFGSLVTITIIINVETVVVLDLVGTIHDTFYSRFIWWIESSKAFN